MRILIVDDHEVVREGLVASLGGDARFDVVGAAATAVAAQECARRTLPDVALVDLHLPDMPGEELCRILRENFPSMAVIVLTTYLSEETVRGALRAGATEYVTKAAGLPALRDALERILEHGATPVGAGASQIVHQLHQMVAARTDAVVATPQQERVLELAAEGLTNKEIGGQLFISESTVRFHVQNLKTKLGARTKTELIAKAMRAGIISVAPEDDARGE